MTINNDDDILRPSVDEMKAVRRRASAPKNLDRARNWRNTAQYLELALIIIACLGIAGTLSVSAVGWTALALGGSALLCQFMGRESFLYDRRKRTRAAVEITYSSVGVLFGTLGGAGLMAAGPVGLAILTIPFAVGIVFASGQSVYRRMCVS